MPGVIQADLHIHTTASDGRLTPSACVAVAVERGLTALAVTDHDTLAGIAEAQAAAPAGLTVLSGVEIAATWRVLEVHILGYGCRPDDDDLNAALVAMRDARERRLGQILARLAALGLPTPEATVRLIAGEAVIGRPHIAQALVELGHATSVGAAFDAYLGNGRPAYVDRLRLSCEQAVALIKGAGGVPILAHPGALPDDGVVHSLLARGVRGLEVFHPLHDGAAERRFLALARRERLLVTGGSDYHGIAGEGSEIADHGVSVQELTLLLEAVRHTQS